MSETDNLTSTSQALVVLAEQVVQDNFDAMRARVPAEPPSRKPKISTVQEPKQGDISVVTGVGEQALAFLTLTTEANYDQVPDYGTAGEDAWLAQFVRQPGNDLLAGAISTMVGKIASTSWYLEGPKELVEFARKQLLNWSDFGRGYNSLIEKFVWSFYVRNLGGLTELLRSSARDKTGPAMGYAHLDESKCILSGDPTYPIYYNNSTKGQVKVHMSQVSRIVDQPAGEGTYRGLGWSSTRRTATTALLLMDVVRYSRERVSDLPPAGLLILQNIGPNQWEDLKASYSVRQRNEGNTTWRDIMVALGVDPAYPASAEWVEFASLDHLDYKTAIEMTIYSFALGFNSDPREFWPVSAGPLGTATEAEIQAQKARGKGVGRVYTAIEREFNRPECLPPGVTFHYDFQDDEEDSLRANINDKKTQWVRRLWEASPNRPEDPTGIITTEQAQQLLVWEKVVPPEIMGLDVHEERVYDIRAAGWGPKIRLYRDGSTLNLSLLRQQPLQQ
jgi:hypothetical protein